MLQKYDGLKIWTRRFWACIGLFVASVKVVSECVIFRVQISAEFRDLRVAERATGCGSSVAVMVCRVAMVYRGNAASEVSC